MTHPSRPVVVLNAHYTGLGIARSLSDLPVTVYGLTAETGTPARSSRRLQIVASPDTEREPLAAAEFLLKFSAGLEGRPLLVPTRDHDVHFVMQHRDRLETRFDLCMAPNEVLDRILNKQALFAVASSVGIHCPRSFEVSDSSTLEAALAAIAMPVVAKPLFSRDWRRPDVRRIVRKNKAFVFESAGQVTALYEGLRGIAPQMILQEFIPGGDDQLVVFGSYVDRNGVPRAQLTARKVLQHPRVCGNGVAIRAETMPPDVTEHSLALLKALNYRGVSELEFKRDATSGRLALIEMNARHWDQHRLSDAVGASVTRAMYEDWLELPPVERHQCEQPWTLIIEDAWLRGLADAVRGRAGTPTDFMRLLRPPLRGALWDAGDPQPFLSMLNDLRRSAAGAGHGNRPQ